MHEAHALADMIRSARDCDLLVIVGASAITDRRDVVPIGVALAGGTVEQLGMPVDPGGMLLLGRITIDPSSPAVPIIGAPGCIRSPNIGSFDFVLQRILAGFAVIGSDLRRMGVGDLISQPTSLPGQRHTSPHAPVSVFVD